MLTELRIADLGVIDDATVEFGPGFTAVTGETGAGKTMVVTGLGLLIGGRADSGLVRSGSARALIEGRLGLDADLTRAVEDAGGELDDGEVLLSRVLTASRSRARVGGVQVPLPTLADVVGERITIHGQSEQLRLGSADRQREVLDTYAVQRGVGGAPGARQPGFDAVPVATAMPGEAEVGHGEVLAEYRSWWARRRAWRAELADLTERAQERARELAALEFGLGEIAKAEPQPGEDEVLRAEARRLQAADDLRLAARTALVALAGDDEAVDDAPDVLGLLSVARRALAAETDADPQLEALNQRLDEASWALTDVAGDLASYLASLEADPARLEWIASRLSELQTLSRRYGPSIDDVLAWAEQAAVDVGRLSGSDDRIAELDGLLAEADAALAALASTLGRRRRDAAAELSALVEAELAALAMPRARLSFELTPTDELGPHGGEQVALLFSANPGSPPGPLAKVASGGELSRVRLALEVVLAAQSDGHTFVFDEVDAGVGGAVALEIGRRLARLAEHSQVIVVTHLAQVAAFADRHYMVSKADEGQVTTSGVRLVTADDRLDVLATMMGGLESSESALAHARELLEVRGAG